jgi:WD40 repeat protein
VIAASMRELTLGLIRSRDFWYGVRKEVALGVVSAVVPRLILAVVGYLWKSNGVLDLMVGAGLGLNLGTSEKRFTIVSKAATRIAVSRSCCLRARNDIPGSGRSCEEHAQLRMHDRGRKGMSRRNKFVLLVGLLALIAPCQGSGGKLAARPAKPAKGDPPPTLMLREPPGTTSALALSADGKLLVTGMDDAARLWDAASGRVILAFDHHADDGGRISDKGRVVSVCLSKDNRFLVTRRSHDDRAHLHELATGKLIRSFKHVGEDETRGMVGMALSEDGKRLAIGNQLWDVATGERIRVLPHTGPIEALCFAGNGKYLASVGRDGVARLWDVAAGKEVRAFAPAWGCSVLALSGDGKRLVTGDNDGVARLWNTSTGKVIRTFTGHARPIRSVALSADGNKLATSGPDRSVRLWDVTTGKQIRTFAHSQAIVSMTPDGKWLATGGWWSTRAVLWDVETGKEVRQFQGLAPSASASLKDLSAFGSAKILVVTPDGRWLVTGDNNGTGQTLSLWDLVQGKRVRGFQAEKGTADSTRTVSVTISGDGKRLALARGTDRKAVQVWDLRTGKLVRTFDGQARFAILSSDGKRLVTGDRVQGTRLWDVDTGKSVRAFGGHHGLVSAAALSPNGKWLCTGDLGGMVWLWDVPTGKLITKLRGHPAGVTSVAFTPDVNRVVSAGANYPGGGDGAIRVWDIDTGKELHVLPHKGKVRSLNISPDGKRLFSDGGYRSARIWDLRTGKQIREFPHHRMLAAVASADHKRVLTCGVDRAPRVWDGATGKELCRLTSTAAGDWVVFDAAGRFDALNRGDVDLAALHWVRGLETFPLRHFRERFFDPGLLAKHLGFAAAPLRRVK